MSALFPYNDVTSWVICDVHWLYTKCVPVRQNIGIIIFRNGNSNDANTALSQTLICCSILSQESINEEATLNIFLPYNNPLT